MFEGFGTAIEYLSKHFDVDFEDFIVMETLLARISKAFDQEHRLWTYRCDHQKNYGKTDCVVGLLSFRSQSLRDSIHCHVEMFLKERW